MALPVLVNRFYVQASFQRSTDNPVTNTFCFVDLRGSGAGVLDTEVLVNIRNTLDGFYGTRTQAGDTVGWLLSASVHTLKYVVYPLSVAAAAAGEIPSATFPESPGAGTAILPPDVALVITWRTAQRGKSYRGRTYLGPLSSTFNTSGRPSATAVDAAAAAAGKLYGAWAESHDLRLNVMSRMPGIGANHVVRADIDNEFDTQRRRGFRVNARTSAPVG